MMTRRYSVRGMDCAEETAALQKTVGRLSGVSDLSFNLLTGVMEVTLSPDGPGDDAILSAVKRAGLEARRQMAATGMLREGALAPVVFWNNPRIWLCAGSGGLLLLGVFSHAFLHGNWTHAWVGGITGCHGRFPLVSVLLFVASTLAGGWFVFPKALLAVRRLSPDMNVLMTLAVAGAMVTGEWLEAATVTFLFSVSNLLESWSVSRARHTIRSLLNVAAKTARYRCPHNDDVEESPVEEIAVGVCVLVRPGERVPLDGVVTKGTTFINQAPITGESVPVAKEPGQEVFAGTINETGAIEFRVTHPFEDTTLSRVIRMVEEAHSRRAPSELWVDAFARYYTPAVVAVAVLVAVVPPCVLGGGWSAWFYEALVILVIACPCALVISTPVSIVSALASAARNGVLIKGGAFLEAIASLKVIALDKTGTVTRGRPEVQKVVPLYRITERELLALASALETHSGHPLAQAILRYAAKHAIAFEPSEDFQELKGRGAEGIIAKHRFWLGRHRLLHEKKLETTEIHAHIEAMENDGYSVVVIGAESHVCGLLGIADTIRAEAAQAVHDMEAAGTLRVVMLTGDNLGTALAVARKVAITEVRAELLPEEKMRAILDYVRDVGPTAMIGDGINDAPALAAATVGIAMGAAGSDAAIETADIALMSDDLARIPWLMGHAQRSRRIIRQNITFALGVKFVVMALALTNRATLWMAIASDMGVSLLVIANALRLLSEASARSRPLRN